MQIVHLASWRRQLPNHIVPLLLKFSRLLMANKEKKLIFELPEKVDFQSFCKDSKLVLKFFRNISESILKITPNYGIVIAKSNDFITATVYYGAEASGPNKFPVCLSCKDAVICTNNYHASKPRLDLLNERLRQLRTDQCEITVLSGQPDSNSGTKCWVDCQARPILVATPKRHTNDMCELNDDELCGLWASVGNLLAFMSKCANTPTWRVIHLNAGTYRNIEHMHVKIVFDAPEFMDMVRLWPEEYRILFEDLKEIRRIMKLPDYEVLLESIGDVEGAIKVKVVGVFDQDDIPELDQKFSAFGKVNGISIASNAAIIEMESKYAAVEAIVGLNLTKLGKRNISCRTKL